MAQTFDLFGDPIPENWGRRGRPAHIRTAENINKITMLVALGWSNQRIANALDITLPTLRKHYFSLIGRLRSGGRDRLDAAYAMRLWRQVESGNVGAMRLWAAFVDRNDRMEVERTLGSSAGAKGAAEAAPGKKVIDEQRAIAADADLMAELDREAAQNGPH